MLILHPLKFVSTPEFLWEQSRAEQSRAKQSRAEQGKAEQSRAEQSAPVLFLVAFKPKMLNRVSCSLCCVFRML